MLSEPLNAGPNPKCWLPGVTYYSFASDQFTGFHAIVVPGTIRDSLFILEGLLEQQSSLRPHEVMSDTAGYSDLVFGLFWLLGYQFSPRLADFGDARFWRIGPKADYGALNGLARQRIKIPRIERNWDDMLRVAGSLKMGVVGASELARGLQGGGNGGGRSLCPLIVPEDCVGILWKAVRLIDTEPLPEPARPRKQELAVVGVKKRRSHPREREKATACLLCSPSSPPHGNQGVTPLLERVDQKVIRGDLAFPPWTHALHVVSGQELFHGGVFEVFPCTW